MAEHRISAGVQDIEGRITDPPPRSESTVSKSAFCLWGIGDSSHSSRHPSWDLERHVSEVVLLDKGRLNLRGADFSQIHRDVRRARRFLLKWELSEAYELIDRIECALADLPSSVASPVRAETNVLRAMGAALQD